MGRRVRWSLIRSAEALRFNNSGSALFKSTSYILLLTSDIIFSLIRQKGSIAVGSLPFLKYKNTRYNEK